jgi:predicted MPP superfamily phosphohydrolase
VTEKKDLTLWVEQSKEFKVVQFADLHFGKEGSSYHNYDIERSLEFIDFTIKSDKPDFIVLLGDNMMSQGIEGAKFIIETFDKYKIPYTFVFGNHDAELYLPTYSKAEVSSYLEKYDSPYLLYESGYTQNDSENRYGNFSIKIKDTKTQSLIGAFIVMDTGVYDYQKEKYQYINEGQIEWYRQEITTLNAIYKNQKNNVHSTIPTITYGHMQLPEFAEIYRNAKNGEGAEFIYYQDLNERMLSSMASGYGTLNYSFFDTMKEMKSSRAYFCGHMHGLKCHVKTGDIILGFCPQACVTRPTNAQISTFAYTVNKQFDMQFNLITEQKNNG